jgi:hypothetical protein
MGVSYRLSGWVFSTDWSFDQDGPRASEFSAVGPLGALTIASVMTFDPRVAVSATYTPSCIGCIQTQSIVGVDSSGSSAAWTHSVWDCVELEEVLTTRPAFSSLEARAYVSLFGVDIESLFYLKGDDFGPTTVTGKWVYGDPFKFCSPSTPCSFTQTASYTASSSLCEPRFGSGWKFTLSGSFGNVLVTSRSYFNLEEYTLNQLMAKARLKQRLEDTLAMGGVYYLPKADGETCDVRFTRQYITLEQMGFGCLELDVGISLLCSGFEWARFLISNIDLGPWIGLDTLMTFSMSPTGSRKTVELEPELKIGSSACVGFELVIQQLGTSSGTALDGVRLNGIRFSYDWNGIRFTEVTSFNPAYEALGGFYLAAPVASKTTHAFFVPDPVFAKNEFDTSTGEGYYKQVCYPEEWYDIRELISLEGSGDSCCGGGLQWAANIYFGDRKLLIADSFWFWYADEDGNSYQYNTTGNVNASAPAILGGDPPYCEDDDVSYGASYYDAPGDTLLGWIKADVSLQMTVAPGLELSFAMGVTVYGWESLTLGVSASW